MRTLFQVNGNLIYPENHQAEKNTFINQPVQTDPLPVYEDIKDRLPRPVWDGHEDAVSCYYKAWQLAFGNLRQANADAGFVSNFIDTAFNGFLFMWDSSFIVMFGKYASHIFNFQRTLDNMYSHQHRDGFICREICETESGDQWSRDDPSSTGPNIMPWSEWEYYLLTDDKERLARVFDPLCAYHRWLQLNRSWPDGSYWANGLSCGMDNQPRVEPGYNWLHSHSFMSWIDICSQQYLSANILIQMAKELGYKTFFWSLAYVDWMQDQQPSKEEAFSKLLTRIHPGAIVLLHSTSQTNAQILDELLAKWEEMGYQFGQLDEL